MPSRLLPRDFFIDAPDEVARRLLGKLLVRKPDSPEDETTSGRIVEVEAYFGEGDPAAHAYSGKTARNAVLFGPPGRAYVYLIYGMHHCLNISCEPQGIAGCVLLRALEPVVGLATMAKRRGLPSDASARLLTSGPGRMCQAMGINRLDHNGIDVTGADSLLTVMEDDYPPPQMDVTPRIGIKKSAERLLRFSIQGNKFVSKG
uniref:Putative 3-methyladenine DNA glycosylase n=1 Tax=Acidobacterium capsulatum TaxID=33075 RepID=A0A7V4XRH8_9BACT